MTTEELKDTIVNLTIHLFRLNGETEELRNNLKGLEQENAVLRASSQMPTLKPKCMADSEFDYIIEKVLGLRLPPDQSLALSRDQVFQIERALSAREEEKEKLLEQILELKQAFSDFTKIASQGESKNTVDSNGHEYVDLGLPSGRLWARCNIGAKKEEDFGMYFQWGDVIGHAAGDGYEFLENTNDISVCEDLSLDNDAANFHLGGSWHMPTKEDFQELKDNCSWKWISQGGVDGYKVTSWSNGNYIFFPASGYYYGTSLSSRGSNGYYWSRSFSSSSNAYNLGFGSSSVSPQNINNRYSGFTARAVL